MVTAAGHTILRNLDLTVARGEHVAIVGLSGAGKSSLIGLLLGWHRLAEGRLLVDGAELTEDSLNALRRSAAWVDPAIQIWNKSFLDNLNYSSRDSDLVRAGSAIDSAHLREVLQKLPHGLQTPLGEGGALLSGGEGQRVRLGRALVQSDVRLALLDEPFRGMDREQRSGLLSDARRHWGDATLLCVTHDVSETLSFDRVLVIEDGMIREDDRPSRLAGRPSRYRELLDAEQLVRDRMWAGKQWRHIRIENGVVAHDR
jgi:ATP-binding cassette subfamily B protein